jgi:hypothetical protein
LRIKRLIRIDSPPYMFSVCIRRGSRRCGFVADAHRGDGKRFVARSDEKLRLLELEAAIWLVR